MQFVTCFHKRLIKFTMLSTKLYQFFTRLITFLLQRDCLSMSLHGYISMFSQLFIISQFLSFQQFILFIELLDFIRYNCVV